MQADFAALDRRETDARWSICAANPAQIDPPLGAD